MGLCGSLADKNHHIMLAGIEKCGKTYFLYSRLNQFITASTKIRTKPTKSFNYERVDFGSFTVFIWDLPGKENLRMLWPNFYRSIDFSGLIYLIDYDNKDTLAESIKVMHELLSEEELSDVHVVIVMNYAKKEFHEFKDDEKVEIEDLKDKVADNENSDGDMIKEQIMKDIYFHLIMQVKSIFICDIFEENATPENHILTRNFFKQFISKFD